MDVGMTNENSVVHLSHALTRGNQLDLEEDNSNQYKSSSLASSESSDNIKIDAELQPLEPTNIGIDDSSIHGLLPITNIRSDKIVETESWRTRFDEKDTK